MNIDAPFYSLVMLIERVARERRIERAVRPVTVTDWLVVIILAGGVVLGIVIDQIKQMDRRLADRYDRAASHDRLLDELWRQP